MDSEKTIPEQIRDMFKKVSVITSFSNEDIHENALFKGAKELLSLLRQGDPLWAETVTLHEGRKSEVTLTMAHLAVLSNALPFWFDNWELTIVSSGKTYSVATLAAYVNRLPLHFNKWSLADELGWSVAHAYASKRNMPLGFSDWELKTHDGITVREVQAMRQQKPF